MSDVVNYQHRFPKFFPSVKMLSSRGEVSVYEVHMRLASDEFVMTTKHVVIPLQSHEMFVIGGDLKGSRVKEFFESENGKYTKIAITANFNLGPIKRINQFLRKRSFTQEVEIMFDTIIGTLYEH